MSRTTPVPSQRPGRPLPTTLAGLLPGAVAWAFLWALAGSVLLAVLHVTSWIATGGPGYADLPLGSIAERSGLAVVVLCLPLLAGRLGWQSRALMDRVFAGVGLATTLFGLLMLVVFFVSLGVQAWHWFEITPRMVRAENERWREVVRGTDQAQTSDNELAAVRRELQDRLAAAPSPEEKAKIRQHYEDVVLPATRRDVERTLAERQTIARKSIREDTSPPALLAYFLTASPGNLPQDASVYPALLGSLWIALLTILLAFPVGVGAALYLEEYRTRGWLNALIQANINNLAAVPSVVYGVLGAFLFVELIFRPLEQHLAPAVAARNVLGGGLTLGLLTLPAVIAASREAIRAVPQALRHGAYALSATRWQVIWHNVLPLASPGIVTGTILSLSRAVGEAAPLVLFGTLLFVNREPGLFSRFTVLPMQIFSWTDRPAEWFDGEPVEIWQYNAAVASILLLLLLLGLNAAALVLRNRMRQE